MSKYVFQVVSLLLVPFLMQEPAFAAIPSDGGTHSGLMTQNFMRSFGSQVLAPMALCRPPRRLSFRSLMVAAGFAFMMLHPSHAIAQNSPPVVNASKALERFGIFQPLPSQVEDLRLFIQGRTMDQIARVRLHNQTHPETLDGEPWIQRPLDPERTYKASVALFPGHNSIVLEATFLNGTQDSFLFHVEANVKRVMINGIPVYLFGSAQSYPAHRINIALQWIAKMNEILKGPQIIKRVDIMPEDSLFGGQGLPDRVILSGDTFITTDDHARNIAWHEAAHGLHSQERIYKDPEWMTLYQSRVRVALSRFEFRDLFDQMTYELNERQMPIDPGELFANAMVVLRFYPNEFKAQWERLADPELQEAAKAVARLTIQTAEKKGLTHFFDADFVSWLQTPIVRGDSIKADLFPGLISTADAALAAALWGLIVSIALARKLLVRHSPDAMQRANQYLINHVLFHTEKESTPVFVRGNAERFQTMTHGLPSGRYALRGMRIAADSKNPLAALMKIREQGLRLKESNFNRLFFAEDPYPAAYHAIGNPIDRKISDNFMSVIVIARARWLNSREGEDLRAKEIEFIFLFDKTLDRFVEWNAPTAVATHLGSTFLFRRAA